MAANHLVSMPVCLQLCGASSTAYAVLARQELQFGSGRCSIAMLVAQVARCGAERIVYGRSGGWVAGLGELCCVCHCDGDMPGTSQKVMTCRVAACAGPDHINLTTDDHREVGGSTCNSTMIRMTSSDLKYQ